jgi:D-alanyl-D-alanine carboxypeptidase
VTMERGTHKIVWSKNADTPGPIASLAKMAPIVMAYNLGLANTEVEVPTAALSKWDFFKKQFSPQGPHSTICSLHDTVYRFQRFTMKDVWNQMVVASNNWAAYALELHLTKAMGKDFALLAPAYLESLGMKNSFLVDATGLSNATDCRNDYSQTNRAAAHDIAIMTDHFLNIPGMIETLAKPSVSWLGRPLRNTNSWVRKESIKGAWTLLEDLVGKTGFTGDAGFNFAGTIKGSNYIYVALNCPSIAARDQSLLKQVLLTQSMLDKGPRNGNIRHGKNTPPPAPTSE